MKRTPYIVSCAVVLLLTAGAAQGQLGPAFSLDDNPQLPLTSPPGWIPGLGAEDPFGIGTYGGPLAPSPTLVAVPAMDGDIAEPNPAGFNIPALDVAMSGLHNQPFGYVDAISDNRDVGHPKSNVIHIGFSVDRISMGMPGTAVNMEAGFNQQPGDLYRTQASFQHPVFFLGMPPGAGYMGPLPTAGVGGSNFMMFDESQLMLTPGLGVGNQIGPGQPCPPILPGTHDNVDAANWQRFDTAPQDNITDKWLYFSVNPDERATSGALPAHVYSIAPNTPAMGAALYAPGNQMGLFDVMAGEEDNIDGLVIWDDPGARLGVADPGLDYALFSLSHGSLSLSQYGLTESDVFFTNFQGAFWLYARGADLGLADAPGLLPGDNVDALEMMIPADANLDGIVDVQDFSILKANFGGPGGWLQGDFNGDGIIDVQDFTILKANFGAKASPGVSEAPEPASASVLLLGAVALLRRRKK